MKMPISNTFGIIIKASKVVTPIRVSFEINFSNVIRAFAPASIGNIGVGFDIMGLAINGPGDEVVARFSEGKGVRIVAMTGDNGNLPLETEKNTAGMAVLRLVEFLGDRNLAIDIEVHKKLPLGSGMGSSAASAVAAVVAVNELLRAGLSKHELLPFACAGEAVASGSLHADNVAPCLLGGITLIRSNAPYDIHNLNIPKDLCVVIVHPNIQVLTSEARAILSPTVPMKAFIQQTANAAGFVLGLQDNNFGLIGRSLRDVVIEPQRASLIPGFYAVQEAAFRNGALGCSISGAGPAIFALFDQESKAQGAVLEMQAVFTQQNISSNTYVSPVNENGAVLL
jgi:homoserine kinase